MCDASMDGCGRLRDDLSIMLSGLSPDVIELGYFSQCCDFMVSTGCVLDVVSRFHIRLSFKFLSSRRWIQPPEEQMID